MIQGKYYSSSYPTKSSSSRNLIPSTSGPWKRESYLHLGDPGADRENKEGRTIMFMDPNRQNDEEEYDRGDCSIVFEKEHMFDKVVTPSDVGKLNRLVIPKQHAQKYFPLDPSNCEKGLLLNFEDRTGKSWRFRYSYWNSSQSYVMTKGWSRFVKEMKLDPGDIVSFQRGVGDLGKDRLFIDWRRRTHLPDPHPVARNHLDLFPGHVSFSHSVHWDLPAPQDCLRFSQTGGMPNHSHRYSLSGPVRRIYDYGYGETPTAAAASNYGAYDKFYHRSSGSSPYMGRGEVDTQGDEPPVPIYKSVPVVQAKEVTATKRFRLFGVNMECVASDSNCEDNSQPLLPPDLMLYDGGPVTPMTRFLSKGKASMSLDLDL